jgi:hypothetical protein
MAVEHTDPIAPDVETPADRPGFEALEVLMRKLISAGLAALTLIGGSAAVTAPANAAPHGGWHGGGGWRGGGGWHGGGWRGGRGYGYVGAGLLGFGLGAALAAPYYDYGYYGYPGYPYDYGYYGGCGRRVWNPYYGRYIIERGPYC